MITLRMPNINPPMRSKSMPDVPRIIVANRSCWDVFERNASWLSQQPAEIVSDAQYHLMAGEAFEKILMEADGAVGPWRKITARQMERSERLKVISFASSGYDNICLEDATRHGIVVTNAPVVELSESVADQTIGLMLAVSRKIPHYHHQICAGDHSRGLDTTIWNQTLGIVGLGAIGRATAARAKGFSMRILASEPFPDESFVAKHEIELVQLDTLLQQSDYVSLHVRLTPETRDMIGKRELGLMQPTAFLINTARQDLIDEPALAEALLAGEIAGAGLDDPPYDAKSPLLNRDDVVFAPHQGNRTFVACDMMLRHGVTNALLVLQGERPDTVLNPEVYEARLRAQLPND
jgi:phosphoglycerate dehydrogenase-like enzyme